MSFITHFMAEMGITIVIQIPVACPSYAFPSLPEWLHVTIVYKFPSFTLSFRTRQLVGTAFPSFTMNFRTRQHVGTALLGRSTQSD